MSIESQVSTHLHGRVESSALWLIKNECKRITDDLELSDGWRSRTSLNLFVADLEVPFHNEMEFELKHFDNPRLAKAPLCRRAFGSVRDLQSTSKGSLSSQQTKSRSAENFSSPGCRREASATQPSKTLAIRGITDMCIPCSPSTEVHRPVNSGWAKPAAGQAGYRGEFEPRRSGRALHCRHERRRLPVGNPGRVEPCKEISAHGANRPTFTFTRNFPVLLTSTCRNAHPAMAEGTSAMHTHPCIFRAALAHQNCISRG